MSVKPAADGVSRVRECFTPPTAALTRSPARPLEKRVERGDHLWIEFVSPPVCDDVPRFERRHRLAIGAIARQRIVHVGHRDDARLERDGFAAGRVVAADPSNLSWCARMIGITRRKRTADRLEHLDAARDVLLDRLVLFARQPSGFVEQIAADIELADVVQQRGGTHVLDAVGRRDSTAPRCSWHRPTRGSSDSRCRCPSR